MGLIQFYKRAFLSSFGQVGSATAEAKTVCQPFFKTFADTKKINRDPGAPGAPDLSKFEEVMGH